MKNNYFAKSAAAFLSAVALLSGCDVETAASPNSDSTVNNIQTTENNSETSVQTDITEETTAALNESVADTSAEESKADKTAEAEKETSAETEKEVKAEETKAENTDTQEEGSLLPPVSEDLQNLFNDAYQLYKEFSVGGNMFCLDFDENNDYSAEKDVTIDGNVYSLTSEKYFTTLQDVYDYYHKYFTDDYIKKTDILSKFKEYEGRVYTNTGAKGGIIGYSGHTYEITSQTDDEIDIKAVCYIVNDMANESNKLFFCEPDNPDDYDTIERNIVFKKENGTWLIDNIELMW